MSAQSARARDGGDGGLRSPRLSEGPRGDQGPLDFARLRRLRGSEGLRRMVAETRLSPSDFIYPLFVTGGRRVRRPIAPMPGCFQLSVDEAVKEAKDVASLGIPAVLLFGLPERPDRKDARGTGAYDGGEAVQRAVAAIKRAVPAMVVITDVCLCEYTDH